MVGCACTCQALLLIVLALDLCPATPPLRNELVLILFLLSFQLSNHLGRILSLCYLPQKQGFVQDALSPDACTAMQLTYLIDRALSN